MILRNLISNVNINRVAQQITRSISSSVSTMAPVFKYPLARRDETTEETYFGKKVNSWVNSSANYLRYRNFDLKIFTAYPRI